MIPKVIKEAARELRKHQTKAEYILWEKIKDDVLWHRILRQKPIFVYTEYSWLDRYIISDFYIADKKLIIEVDWDIHLLKEVLELDKHKEELLINRWFSIIRIQNEDIYHNLETVIQKIKIKLT